MFWEGAPSLVNVYRKAYDLKRTAQNQELWLQGLYNYQAVSTALAELAYGLNGRKGKKPQGYIDHPLPLTTLEIESEKQKRIQHTLEWFRKGQKQK